MGVKVKLTKAQKECLSEMARQPARSLRATAAYKPTKRLVEMGLATRQRGRFSHDEFKITEEGRRILSTLEHD